MEQSSLQVNQIELVASRAWPAEEYDTLDGWTIRANNGITWRANSVLPFSDLREVSLNEAIDFVVGFYGGRNIFPAFKLTHSCSPKNLDDVLESKGFKKEMETFVQTSNLTNHIAGKEKYSVRVSSDLDQDWITAYNEFGEYDNFALENRIGIINRITSRKGFAKVRAGGQVIGVGRGVVENDLLGLFGIITAQKHRGKGVATSINAALMEWGRDLGARSAYLQVEKKNAPALALYAKTGFQTAYEYWYRILRN